MYTLKSIARRVTSFAAAMALVVSSVGSAVLPAMSAYADALNPLANRSLTLSSGSPGWAFTDGSGNATYAPPNSGANGQKTGNTFDFRTSSSATVKEHRFQYCTASAGDCMGLETFQHVAQVLLAAVTVCAILTQQGLRLKKAILRS